MKQEGEVGGGSVRYLCRFSNILVTGLLGVFVLVAAAGRARAADFSFRFDLNFDGAAPAATNLPWVNLNFQADGPGRVLLNISANGLTGTEFLSDFYLNLNPLLNPHKLR